MLLHNEDPRVVRDLFFDLIVCLEADELDIFETKMLDQEQLCMAFVARRIQEIIQGEKIFATPSDAKKYFAKILSYKLAKINDRLRETLDEPKRD